MGIDATALCTALPRRLLMRMSGPQTLRAIETLTQDWALSQGLGPVCTTAPQPDEKLAVLLVPVADPIVFTASDTRLTAGFRSSNTGPGFHAAVVDLLDHLAEQLKITWGWTATDGTPLDETGFAQTRDFAALQATMAGFLTSLAGVAQQMAATGTQSQGLCVPLGLGHVAGQIGGPMGLFPATWPDDHMALSEPHQLAAAASFFPWWDAGLTAQTVERLLRAQLWQTAEWRPPVSEQDRRTQAQIAHNRAWLGRLGHPIPADLQQALQEYDHHQTSESPPADNGIGYRKRLIHQQIFSSWSISRPAYAWPVDNGSSAAWEHPGFWLSATSLTIDTTPGTATPFVWPAPYTGPIRDIRPGLSYRLTTPTRDENGQRLQQALIVSPRIGRTELLLVTLSSHLEWPYDRFETWIATVGCPDLPDSVPPALPSPIVKH